MELWLDFSQILHGGFTFEGEMTWLGGARRPWPMNGHLQSAATAQRRVNVRIAF